MDKSRVFFHSQLKPIIENHKDDLRLQIIIKETVLKALYSAFLLSCILEVELFGI